MSSETTPPASTEEDVVRQMEKMHIKGFDGPPSGLTPAEHMKNLERIEKHRSRTKKKIQQQEGE